MNDSRVQEDGYNETPPLIGLFASVPEVCDVGLIGYTAHAAELAEGAGQGAGVERGGVGARPGGYLGVDDLLDVVHAWGEASTHVDEDVGRGADHDVEVWFCLDGRACQDTW